MRELKRRAYAPTHDEQRLTSVVSENGLKAHVPSFSLMIVALQSMCQTSVQSQCLYLMFVVHVCSQCLEPMFVAISPRSSDTGTYEFVHSSLVPIQWNPFSTRVIQSVLLYTDVILQHLLRADQYRHKLKA